MSPRLRRLIGIIIMLGMVCLGVWAVTRNSRITAEKVNQYAMATDFAGLTGVDRAEALRRLERMVNGLSRDERRKWRHDGAWRKWFDLMTEGEKGQWLEATMPSGFKQWMNSFDELPADERKKFIEGFMAYLKDRHQLLVDREPGQDVSMYGTNKPPVLTAELMRKAQTIGLRTAYMESSAEAKAQWAPFLEELQQQMERGKFVIETP